MELITQYNIKITQLYYDYAKSYGIRYNSFIVLYVLYLDQSSTQKKICKQTGLPKQTVNTIIKHYLQRGDIEFTECFNKREKLLQFTDKGKKFAINILSPIFNIEERVLLRMGEEKCQYIIHDMEVFTSIFAEELLIQQEIQSHD